jgi:hypothetical protein
MAISVLLEAQSPQQVQRAEFPMPIRKTPPALKHGGYSATAVLPGEDRAAFEKLHRDLVNELTPKGRLEEDIVATIACLMWRKQNLNSYEITHLARIMAELMQNERFAILQKYISPPMEPLSFWLYYFNVGDIDVAIKRVKAGGGAILYGPIEVPGNRWIARCTDPQGAIFALMGKRSHNGIGYFERLPRNPSSARFGARR